MNPEDLGFYERRTGSGIWYLPGRTGPGYAVKVCENPACPRQGQPFMGSRIKKANQPNGQRFCSQQCASAGRKTDKSATCEQCGATYRKRKPTQRYCTRKCLYLASRKEEPNYNALHQRLHYVKGPASKLLCASCGAQATNWSYDGKDPDEIVDPRGLRYSIKIEEHYIPQCLKCHRKQDNYRGENHPHNTTLTEESVLKIYNDNERSFAELARIYATSPRNIRTIREGKTWKHVTGGKSRQP